MRPRIFFSLAAFISVLGSGAKAVPVIAHDWDEFMQQNAAKETDIILESMKALEEGIAYFDRTVSLSGAAENRGSVLTLNEVGYDGGKRGGMFGFKNGGSISNLTFTGETSKWYNIILNEGGQLSISSCSFEKIKASDRKMSLIYSNYAKASVLFEDSTVKDNENVSIYLSAGSKAINSTFTGNKGFLYAGVIELCRSEVNGCLFTGNYVSTNNSTGSEAYGGRQQCGLLAHLLILRLLITML